MMEGKPLENQVSRFRKDILKGGGMRHPRKNTV